MTDEEIKEYHEEVTREEPKEEWKPEPEWTEPYTMEHDGTTLRKEFCWCGCIDCYFENHMYCPNDNQCCEENYIWKEVR